jgi:ribosomal protein L37AE/L43A
MDVECPRCGKKGRVRKSGNDFFRECESCKHSGLYHRNVPLGTLFE